MFLNCVCLLYISNISAAHCTESEASCACQLIGLIINENDDDDDEILVHMQIYKVPQLKAAIQCLWYFVASSLL